MEFLKSCFILFTFSPILVSRWSPCMCLMSTEINKLSNMPGSFRRQYPKFSYGKSGFNSNVPLQISVIRVWSLPFTYWKNRPRRNMWIQVCKRFLSKADRQSLIVLFYHWSMSLFWFWKHDNLSIKLLNRSSFSSRPFLRRKNWCVNRTAPTFGSSNNTNIFFRFNIH